MLCISRFAGLGAFAVLSAGLGWAQFDTATVSGVVRDQAQAVVAGSRVTLESVATGVVKSVATDQNGGYTFSTSKLAATN